MALNIPDTAIKQVRLNDFLTDQGDRGFSVQYKGTSYSDLKSAANGYQRGDEVETGWVLANWNLEGVPGGGGILTINCVPADTFTDEETTTQYPSDETWTCRSVRNDVSILAYCGPDDSNPNRAWIELWQKETDDAVARAGGYTRPDGTVADLSEQDFAAATSELMAKIEKGVESVMRFYPVISRNRKYDNCPATFLENLGQIDTPPTPGNTIDNPNIPVANRKKVKKPTNLASITNAHQWVKVQDDVVEQGDGSFVRTESWMGIKKNGPNASPWDPDLYGPDMWPMPYVHGGSAS